jgi:hypothetical protein
LLMPLRACAGRAVYPHSFPRQHVPLALCTYRGGRVGGAEPDGMIGKEPATLSTARTAAYIKRVRCHGVGSYVRPGEWGHRPRQIPRPPASWCGLYALSRPSLRGIRDHSDTPELRTTAEVRPACAATTPAATQTTSGAARVARGSTGRVAPCAAVGVPLQRKNTHTPTNGHRHAHPPVSDGHGHTHLDRN